ncbi:MAG: FtsW/RodA/SpoVE family cell cycle protein [Candidatus Roizmanbacteria bacterium]
MVLFIPSILLLCFSIFNLLGTRPDLVLKVIIFSAISIGLYFFVHGFNHQFLRTNSKLFYWVGIFTLVLTLFIGEKVNGSRSWINLYFFNYQASEVFKVFFVLLFAERFSQKSYQSQNFAYYVQTLFYAVVPIGLILLQPDLGQSLVYIVMFGMLLFFSDIPKKYIFFTIICIIMVLPATWPFLHSFQRGRIMSFVNPQNYEGDISYNMLQAIITIGSGQIFGKGLGLGTQSQLYFLPENHTDFAFSSLVEQFGFVGGAVVLLLFGFIALQLSNKLLYNFRYNDEEHRFEFFMTIGFLSFFMSQLYINVGMNIGIMPITGLALPIISYGGSSLITWFIGIALLQKK